MNATHSQTRHTAQHNLAGNKAKHMIPVLLYVHSDLARTEVERISALAGVHVELATPQTVQESVLRLREIDAPMPTIEASFHPSFASYFASGTLTLTLPDEAEDLLELLLAAGSTQRGSVIGVVGSHGGAGATTLAAWLARTYSADHSTALLDLDPLSAGIDRWLGLNDEPGLRWPDLGEDNGSFVPGRLNAVLPKMGNLRVLSADHRGGVAHGLGERAIAALSQVNSLCVLDLPRSVAGVQAFERGWLEWCDVVLLVGAATSRGLVQMRQISQTMPPSKRVIFVGNGVSGGAEAASLAQELRTTAVLPLRKLRNLNQDLEHGVRLGDRSRCSMARDVARIGQRCLDVA